MLKYLSYIELLIAQMGVGIALVIGKLLLLSHVPVIMQLEVRFFFTFLILFGVLLVLTVCYRKREDNPLKHFFTKRDWWVLLLQALCGGFFFNSLMLLGLKYTTATMAGIIGSAIPAIIAMLSFLILKESISKHKKTAIVLAMVGIAILHLDTAGKQQAENPLLGGFFILLSLLPEAYYTILAKQLAGKIHSLLQATLLNFISTMTFLPVWLAYEGLEGCLKMSNQSWLLLMVSSVFSAGFYFFWTDGVTRVKASTAGLFTGIMPIAATIAAILMVGESFTQYYAIGMGFVLFSIVYGTRGK